MTGNYTQQIDQVIVLFAEAILAAEPDLRQRGLEVDGDVQKVLRQVGLGIVTRILGTLASQAKEEATATGLVVQRRHDISVDSIFGPLQVESPYLWSLGRSARPTQSILGLRNRQRSLAVERALTDFGAEESFGQAVVRFEEHYGWSIGRTSALRLVERRAREVEDYVGHRLSETGRAFAQPLATRPGVDQILVELDGSEIRTGVLVKSDTPETTPIRGHPRRQRHEEWRDVRVGLTRRLDELERTYVARMDSYPVVVRQLFDAAVGRGLSSRTQTIAVGDGGKGLREEIAAQFPGLRFIYDRPHLKGHLYETAEALGLKDARREAWVADRIERIDAGHVGDIIDGLLVHRGRGKKRATQLAHHLERFRDAVHYAAYREQNLPTGSGEIESAHRYIPQKRLKIPGACWHPDTINPMLALRVLRANGWWQDFWTTRLQRNAA